MRRLQIHLDDAVDDALAAEAVRLGTSKAAVIRRALTRDLPDLPAATDDPWQALDGWLGIGGVDVTTSMQQSTRSGGEIRRHKLLVRTARS